MFAGLLVILICAALVAAGIVLVVRGARRGRHRPGRARRSRAAPRRWTPARHVAVAAAAGVGAGIVAAGAGSRLLMRVLALTSSTTDGTFTEGGAEIGEITLGGTTALITFTGVPSGLLTGALYALTLPRSRAGGAALGAALGV
jgi:hypothetical protein